ncbi:unnamed protein product [Parajaminaea phylloscopi]
MPGLLSRLEFRRWIDPAGLTGSRTEGRADRRTAVDGRGPLSVASNNATASGLEPLRRDRSKATGTCIVVTRGATARMEQAQVRSCAGGMGVDAPR